MASGTVKWFNSKKGFGFITFTPEGESAEKDLFVHYSAINSQESNGFKTLYQGDKVTFDVSDGNKGPEAGNVVVTEKGPRPQPRRGGGRGGPGGRSHRRDDQEE